MHLGCEQASSVGRHPVATRAFSRSIDLRIKVADLRGVQESLLLPLYFRAVESRRSKPVIVDQSAAELIRRINYDFSVIGEGSLEQLFAVLRAREFDRKAQSFLSEHPDGTVADIGCGFDTRFQRLDNGRMRWFGLDLPEVIDLRLQLITEMKRTKLIARSALDFTWLNLREAPRGQSALFLAEGVLPYFKENEVRHLLIALSANFRSSQLVCDGMSRMLVRLHNLELAIRLMNFRLGWGVENAHEVESWAPGIRLLGTWSYFDTPEVLARPLWVWRHLPSLRKAAWVAHFAFVAENTPAAVAETPCDPGL